MWKFWTWKRKPKPRGNVAFYADLPDDGVYEEDGEFIQWPGENVALALSSLLKPFGYEATPPQHCEHLGWEFDVLREGCRFWLRLTPGYGFVLFTKDMTRFPNEGHYPRFLESINAVLREDGRFSRAAWFADHEDLPDEGEGAPGPLDGLDAA